MCELEENKPAVIEVREAARQAGVPLTMVPKNLGMGDTWLQDQFQVAYALAGRSQMQVILHLPRVINAGSLFPTTPNLKNFVEHYFPSQSVGLFNEFWEQTIPVSDGRRQNAELSVTESFILYKDLELAVRVLRYTFRQIGEIDPAQKAAFENFKFNNLYKVRLEIRSAYEKLNAYTNVDENSRISAISRWCRPGCGWN
jgi:Protein-arginine deiminase (PAD)